MNDLRTPGYLDTSSFLRKMLFGLWVFFTIAFGIYSTWFFINLYPEKMETGHWSMGFIFSGIYSGVMLLEFALVWKPLNTRFPLYNSKNIVPHIIIQLLTTVVSFFISFGIQLITLYVFYPVDDHDGFEHDIEISLIVLFCLLGMLFTTAFFYSRAFMRLSVESRQLKKESELSALRAQINPHFLFNSLNSIAALIRISPEKAESVTEDLADVFRYTLRASEHPLVLLKDELEIIRLYLNIEKARFAERLTVELDVPDDLLNTPIPVLTLQPLLENAMKHGVSKKEGNHRVKVSIQKVRDVIQISVSDTGPGFQHTSFEELLTKGTGLSNIFQRLKLQFGESVDGAVSDHEISLRFPLQSLETSTEIQTLS